MEQDGDEESFGGYFGFASDEVELAFGVGVDVDVPCFYDVKDRLFEVGEIAVE